MKKIVGLLIAILLIGSTTSYVIYKNNIDKENYKNSTQKKVEEKEECESITGGSFALIFDAESDQKMEKINICIACSSDSYENIPTPTKEGFTFEGWFYDKALTNKVEITNTKDITPIPLKENGCIIGYNDITIYAKFKKTEEDQNPSQQLYYQRINDNQNSNIVQSESNTQEKKYQTYFHNPGGKNRPFTLFWDGGSIGYNNTQYHTPRYGPYIVFNNTPIIKAMADGEVLAKYEDNLHNYGGQLYTIQSLYNNGNKIDYLVIINHIRHSELNTGDSFAENEQIAIPASDYQTPGYRYSVYIYSIDEDIKNALYYCPPASGITRNYQCIQRILYSIINLKRNPVSLIDPEERSEYTVIPNENIDDSSDSQEETDEHNESGDQEDSPTDTTEQTGE